LDNIFQTIFQQRKVKGGKVQQDAIEQMPPPLMWKYCCNVLDTPKKCINWLLLLFLFLLHTTQTFDNVTI